MPIHTNPRIVTRSAFSSVIAIVIAFSTQAIQIVPAPPIEYTISLPAPHTQMVEMSVVVPNVEGDTLDLSLPTWRPGRYVILDFAGTVTEVKAFDNASNKELSIEKTGKSDWRIKTLGSTTIRVEYRVYANSLNDRTRHVDDTHAFLSGVSIFFYSKERRNHPVKVHINVPKDWKIASGLEFEEGSNTTLIAPNYDVLIDSPIETGIHDVINFEVLGKPHEIILWGDCEYDEERMVEDFTKLIETQSEIWGDLPYQRYVFLIHAGRGGGGGTEHLNSTIMQTSKEAIEGSKDNNTKYKGFLGLVSHEFFHTWNVKQLRPAGIHPYDYQTENYSKLFWVAEGTTSYYSGLTLARAGLKTVDKHMDSLAGSIDSFLNRPGRKVQSIEEASFDAWIKFNKFTPNGFNSTVSFYSNGSMVSLALDMRIRAETEGSVSLDDVMRTLYERFPLSGTGYSPNDLLETIEELANAEFDEFFAKYVRGYEDPDFKALLETVGYELYFKPANKKEEEKEELNTEDTDGTEKDKNGEEEEGDEKQEEEEDVEELEEIIPVKADLGIRMGGMRIRTLISNGVASNAGFMSGDEFIAINGERLTSNQLDKRLEDFKPGEEITITFFRRNELREVKVTLGEIPDGSWKLRRIKEPTDLQKANYKSWLRQTWPGDDKKGEDQQKEELNTEDTEGTEKKDK